MSTSSLRCDGFFLFLCQQDLVDPLPPSGSTKLNSLIAESVSNNGGITDVFKILDILEKDITSM